MYNSNYKTYSLNNSGSRWVAIDQNGDKPTVDFLTTGGQRVTRTAQWYESFGNFAVIAISISYKGKLRKVFADTILED